MFGKFNMSSGNQVHVNGTTIVTPVNASISIIGGQVYVNGQKYEGKELEGKEVVNIIIQGNVNNVDCGGSVTVNGEVKGDIDCGGSVKVSGNHYGSINAGGSVRIGQF